MTFAAPLYVVWEITLRCNLRCLHCYSGASKPHPDELTTEEAKGVIRQLGEAGVIILGLSGGEPLLRKDWRELVALGIESGLLVSIGTNGTPVTNRVANELKTMGIHSVCVSLDGSTAGTHEQVRQRPGLFVKTKAAIERLTAAGVRVIVGFTPVRYNFHEAGSVVDLAYELGASGVNLSEFVPVGRGTLDLCLRPDELHTVIDTWAERKLAYQGRMDVLWHDCRVGQFVPPEERSKYIGCAAGQMLARITVDGYVTPCVTLPVHVGNLREQKFTDIWRDSPFLHKIRDRSNIQVGNCSTCDLKSSCGGCRAVSMGFYGDPFRGDPYCWISPEEAAWQPQGEKRLPLAVLSSR
jgi:radical SAM protein with 4Fe4S-binding SPASM domain